MTLRAMRHVATEKKLQWGHGEFAVDDETRFFRPYRKHRRFNGATANSPWMTREAKGKPFTKGELQWGHGEFAVDDRLPLGRRRPRVGWFQWGHGEFAVDDVKAALNCLAAFELQWGHGE